MVNWRLYVDIGNFALKFAIRSGSEWVATDALQHYFGSAEVEDEVQTEIEDLLEEIQSAVEEAGLSPELCSGVAVTSTAQAAGEFLERLGRLFPCEVQRVGRDLTFDLKSEYSRPDLGPDRLANLAAVIESYPLPAVIVDCGTCLTSEIVRADGTFVGGNIAAGMPLISYGLMSVSDRLRAAMEANMEEEPPSPVGRNTAQAIYGGIALQLAGTADRFVEAGLQELGVHQATIIVTGGDGEVVHNLMGFETTFDPLLTLEGLRVMDGFE